MRTICFFFNSSDLVVLKGFKLRSFEDNKGVLRSRYSKKTIGINMKKQRSIIKINAMHGSLFIKKTHLYMLSYAKYSNKNYISQWYY